jgi:serine hydrolase
MNEIKKRKVLFVHSAGHQHGDEGSARLLRYLKEQLSESFQLVAPLMPNPDDPTYGAWSDALQQIFKVIDDGDIAIGHSLGGSVLLKFLSEEQVNVKLSSLHLVAVPFWGLEDWEIDDFMLPDNFATTLPEISSIQIYHSQDDEIVSSPHALRYARELPAASLHLSDGHGHVFWDGLPELVSEIKGT